MKPLRVQRNFDLQASNSLSVPSVADYYVDLVKVDDISNLIQFSQQNQVPIKVLGAGSNLVFSSNVHALVVKNHLEGVHVLQETSEHIDVQVFAGENWHEFVSWCVHQGYSGLENLALIPGTVGASPVQNIGAYGVEVADCLVNVVAVDLTSGERKTLSKDECSFDYRNSVFKIQENRYLICSVTFRLAKNFNPQLSYGPLAKLAERDSLQPVDVFQEIIKLRSAKLPDPSVVPNAGSFFKNPVVSQEQLSFIERSFPNVIRFAFGKEFKLAAGWLIDQAGLKGKHAQDGVGCYEKQALVIVNPMHASGGQVLKWAEHVQMTVYRKFKVTLEIEPRLW